MIVSDIFQLVLFFAVLIAVTPLLGAYMHSVYDGRQKWLSPLENLFYWVLATRPSTEQHWSRYCLAVLGFNFIGLVMVYGLLRWQDFLPLNPMGQTAVSPDLAFNTAVSFVTNTNWQSYSGEKTMSYFSQMMALNVQNFLSAATGMAVAVAVIRGFVRKQSETIGNFWADLVRSTLYILLPLSILFTLCLVWQGVPQNLDSATAAITLEGSPQVLSQGPAASQIAIKQLGTNGGGFYNVNSAHPYENPTPLTNFLQMLAILAISAGFCSLYGRMAGDPRQGRVLLVSMLILLCMGLATIYISEKMGNPFLGAEIVQADGNMEGKEVRFGVVNSSLWATITTAASNGSVNAMHDSFAPLSGLAMMFLMMTGEVAFGGVGSGLYGMLLYVLLSVFIAGLMVGRTPEYLGKKIEAREIRLAFFALFAMPIGVLVIGALAILMPSGLASLQETGPHGFSELLYNYTSASSNNGSAFGGFNANTPLHNTLLGICMLIGRYAYIVPVLAIAGSLAMKKSIPPSLGTFPTHGGLFIGLLIGVILIIGGLTFFPVLVLGPVAEHLAMLNGTQY